ncbi:putative nuclease HARBI1 [Scylla paramamosain]|uniref:putative nuclease HARBI1 n=1 Tax=Scylla paramamosain TaxID=85552 RepID=UPI003083E9E1
MRMDVNSFHTLLGKVEPYITKQDTHLRQSICAEARLEATLRFLASGCSYTALQYSTRISKQSLSLIIPETCKAIYTALRDDYLKTLTTPEEWMTVAHGFQRRWNFPNCLGAIDGKHVSIRAPRDSGSYFYNYKGNHSIVLLAICDANCEFIYADIGTNDRVSDGGVWDKCSVSSLIQNNTAGLPEDAILGSSSLPFPYVFVADDAFPLQRHIMKPFSYRSQDTRERIFSYRLSRARRTVENAFGILANRFRVFHSPIDLPPSKIEYIVLACTSLHNFLIRDHVRHYTPEGSLDVEDLSVGQIIPGTWRQTPELPGTQRVICNDMADGKSVREQFMDYFNGVGSVSWQHLYIGEEG